MTDVTATRDRTAATVTAPRRTRFRIGHVIIGSVVLAAAWELVALGFAATLEHPEYVMPDLVYVLRVGLPGLSDYYSGSLGGTPPSLGGLQSWEMGLLALVENGGISIVRVLLGFTIGVVVGVGLGLLMSALRPVRSASYGVANLLRMLPILALGPLFTLWFGPHTAASVTFISFAIALPLIVATTHAVGNLDRDVVAYARTMGLKRSAVYRHVIIPGILPEISGTLAICVPLAWSVLLASEIYGVQEGLGWMMGEALRFTLVDRITAIAAVFILVTFLTSRALQWLIDRTTRWLE